MESSSEETSLRQCDPSECHRAWRARALHIWRAPCPRGRPGPPPNSRPMSYVSPHAPAPHYQALDARSSSEPIPPPAPQTSTPPCEHAPVGDPHDLTDMRCKGQTARTASMECSHFGTPTQRWRLHDPEQRCVCSLSLSLSLSDRHTFPTAQEAAQLLAPPAPCPAAVAPPVHLASCILHDSCAARPPHQSSPTGPTSSIDSLPHAARPSSEPAAS
jgi:hypothetical protein